MNVLLRIIVKEFLQLRQDRKIIPVLVIGPLVQLLALGFAANTDVKNVPLLLIDQDRTRESRELADRFVASGYFRLAGVAGTVRQIDPWLVRGDAQIALVIGAGFGKTVNASRSGARELMPRVQVIADGSDANSAVVGMGYASSIISGFGAERLQARLVRQVEQAQPTGLTRLEPVPRPGPVPSIELVPRVFYNPDLKSRWFYLPAILALVLMLTTMILPSMAVVREKEIGTLEQLSVTPVRPWQLIAGKLFPFAIIGFVDLILVSLLVVWVFGVPLRGSFALLACLTMLFLANTLGLGLLVSTLVRTQQQAMMTSVFVLMVPMIYLSGLIFPIENMPGPIQHATRAIPLRYYNDIIRGIFLRGSGIAVLWPDAVALAAFGALFVSLASFRFRKTLD